MYVNDADVRMVKAILKTRTNVLYSHRDADTFQAREKGREQGLEHIALESRKLATVLGTHSPAAVPRAGAPRNGAVPRSGLRWPELGMCGEPGAARLTRW
ncbi:MAG: hypothetical protein JWR80_4436 [Bradyrhizobium sp.]|nr:hypothetical protein [Bradyrhizobium sp.]